MNYIVGVLSIVAGLSIWSLAIFALVSWWVFCFGSVVIGLLLLFAAPHILMLPWVITGPGTFLFLFGVALVSTKRDSPKQQAWVAKEPFPKEFNTVADVERMIAETKKLKGHSDKAGHLHKDML